MGKQWNTWEHTVGEQMGKYGELWENNMGKLPPKEIGKPWSIWENMGKTLMNGRFNTTFLMRKSRY